VKAQRAMSFVNEWMASNIWMPGKVTLADEPQGRRSATSILRVSNIEALPPPRRWPTARSFATPPSVGYSSRMQLERRANL